MHDFHEQFLAPFENTAIATRNVYGTIKASTSREEDKTETESNKNNSNAANHPPRRKRNDNSNQPEKRVTKGMTLKPTGRFVLDLA